MTEPPASAAAPAPVAGPVPTAERIVAIDVVRGLAVLGILVMNIVEFGLPVAAYDDPRRGGGTTGIDLWTWFVQMVLFEGRMRGLFSMLFGAGLVLIDERMVRAGRGGGAADVLLRRCLWLALFGIVHRFGLQWTGDILYAYGLLGLVAIAFRRLRPLPLLLAGLLCLSAPTPIAAWHDHQLRELQTNAAKADELEQAGQPVPDALRAARDRQKRRLAEPKPDVDAAELAAVRGGYANVFAYRWDYHHTFQSDYLYYFFVWDVLGMVFVGMALCRWGFFAGAWSPRGYRWMLAAGGLGAALSLAHAIAFADSGFSPGGLTLRFWHDSLHPFVRGIVGLGWASGLLLLLRAGRLRRATTALAAVGQMAFTNYVLQTVCCTLLFFGYGLGFYGSWSRSTLMLVWAGVSAVQIAASRWWLGRFRFGPLEWAWRSLVWWQRQPMRRTAAAPPPAGPA